jgi:hypothetical protein
MPKFSKYVIVLDNISSSTPSREIEVGICGDRGTFTVSSRLVIVNFFIIASHTLSCSLLFIRTAA